MVEGRTGGVVLGGMGIVMEAAAAVVAVFRMLVMPLIGSMRIGRMLLVGFRAVGSLLLVILGHGGKREEDQAEKGQDGGKMGFLDT